MQDKTFCKGCGRKLLAGLFGFGGEQIVEFEDGFYCRECAKGRVNKKRKQ